MQIIIGRDNEKRELKDIYNSGKPEFVVVYGRRRIGKTFLIRELFSEQFAFYHTGLSPVETDEENMLLNQLQSFAISLKNYGLTNVKHPKKWIEAFEMLKELILQKINENPKQRQVIFIDEMPWMDTPRSNFIPAFEHFWNGWCAGRTEIMLIVCGSATSWVSDNLMHNKGGLYGRLTQEIKLHPFSLKECESYYESNNIVMDRYSQLQTYMLLGGVPYYLSFLKKGLSLEQNIELLLTGKNAKLRNELDQLFRSLFNNHEECLKIIRMLASRHSGYTRKEIAEKLNIPYGGGLTRTLWMLEESDFIKQYTYYGKPSKETRYRLVDFFCLCAISILERETKPDAKTWLAPSKQKVMDAWFGFAFETLCWNHIPQIKKALGIPNVQTEEFSWRAEANEEHNGAQIDLIIRRADRIINLCEMKFSVGEYTIDKNDDESIRNKEMVFKQLTKCKESIYPTLVTTYGLISNKYSHRIQSTITMDDLFE